MATHLIRFRTKDDHKKAIMALLEVPQGRLGLPELQMVVGDEHVAALKAGIDFEDRTKVARHYEPNCKTHSSKD